MKIALIVAAGWGDQYTNCECGKQGVLPDKGQLSKSKCDATVDGLCPDSIEARVTTPMASNRPPQHAKNALRAMKARRILFAICAPYPEGWMVGHLYLSFVEPDRVPLLGCTGSPRCPRCEAEGWMSTEAGKGAKSMSKEVAQ